jgi:hypothetical protein
MKPSIASVLLASVLSVAGSARAAGICDWDLGGSQDTWKQRYLTQSLEPSRAQAHHWMGLIAASSSSWARAKLGDLLLPGSHDAGCFGKPSGTTNALTTVLKNIPAWAQTQSHSLLEQLCLGSRWFDVRLKSHKNGWRIFHNMYLFGTSDEALEQYARFAADAAHVDEVVFVRLKLAGSDAEKTALLEGWVTRLKPYLVTNAGTGYGQMTLDEIKKSATGNGARIFLVWYEEQAKGKAPSYSPPEKLAKYLFSYRSNQAGTFSNKVKLTEMVQPQETALAAWKKSPGDKVFATWWTSTGRFGALNVRDNTTAIWPKDKASPDTPLEDFFRKSACEIGTFLLVDFYGDAALMNQKSNLILDLARDYTVKKLAGQKHPHCASEAKVTKKK